MPSFPLSCFLFSLLVLIHQPSGIDEVLTSPHLKMFPTLTTLTSLLPRNPELELVSHSPHSPVKSLTNNPSTQPTPTITPAIPTTLPPSEVKRAQSLLLALVLSLAVLTTITLIFTYFRHRAKMNRAAMLDLEERGDEYLPFCPLFLFPNSHHHNQLNSNTMISSSVLLTHNPNSSYPSSEDDSICRQKLRRSPRRKLRPDSEREKISSRGRITGIAREGLLVPGERWGTRAEEVGVGEEGRRRSMSLVKEEVDRMEDRIAKGYDGFRGN